MEAWRLVRQRPGPSGYVTVVTHAYELPGGQEVEWDVLVGSDSVAVMPMTSDGQVVLVRQYRPGPGQILDELPGGGIEDGESPAQAAARELEEETGFTGQVEIVGATWLAGNATRRRWAAVATSCVRRAAPTPDGGEHVQPVLLSVPDFRAHLRSGQLTDVDIGYLGLDHLGLL